MFKFGFQEQSCKTLDRNIGFYACNRRCAVNPPVFHDAMCSLHFVAHCPLPIAHCVNAFISIANMDDHSNQVNKSEPVQADFHNANTHWYPYPTPYPRNYDRRPTS
mmetsp:Transcript_10732/g.18377  ORF Transcript_10732/g.18377 Transcript_10732/m.18377 type:complete len:106 (-) Transcript_10732:421-738(-)